MKTTLARILEASEIVFWARAKGSNRASLQHAWRRLAEGKLATLCGIHPGAEPVSHANILIRTRRACRHCRRFFPTNLGHPPRTAAAGLAIPPRSGAGDLFQLIATNISRDRMKNDFSLDATLAALAQAIQDHDTDALATAIGNQAIAAIVNARALGIEAEVAFIELAHRHAWFGTLDDAMYRASIHTIEHRSKPLRLLTAFAQSSRALRPALKPHDRIDHVGLQVYYLVAIASLHGLDTVECMRTAIRRFDPSPPAPAPEPDPDGPLHGLLPAWQAQAGTGLSSTPDPQAA